MLTAISIAISVDIAVDSRSTLIDTRSTVDRVSIDCQSSIDRQSTDMYVGRHSFSGHRYLADTSPTLARYLTDTLRRAEKVSNMRATDST